MKTARDPRHLARKIALKELFAWDFQKQISVKNFLAQKVIAHIDKIDEEIQQAAPTRPLKQINRIDLSILRLAIFELIIEKDHPYKVITDEAIELAKEFGGESSPSFVNGALGKLIEEKKLNKKGE